MEPLITQVEMKSFDIGDETPLNGRYCLPFPDGVSFTIDSNSYVFPVDGGDLSSRGFAELLAQYPMFGFIHFNPLLSDADLGELSTTNTLTVGVDTYTPRFQMGRFISGSDDGNAPISTALLPVNDTVTTPKLGCIVSEDIDISPYVGTVGSGGGADSFMVYWKVFTFSDSHDISSRDASYGKHGVLNTPTLKNMVEVDQELSDLTVYISVDSGSTWQEVSRLQTISFCCKVDSLRVAFANNGNEKLYIAHYSVMF